MIREKYRNQATVASVRDRFSSRKGFTLIEIMVVILILGILLAIALPAFVQARSNSVAKSCRENLRMISVAKERWCMEHNQPATATPTWNDLVPVYLKGVVPICGAGGSYQINDMSTDPTCSIGGDHVIR